MAMRTVDRAVDGRAAAPAERAETSAGDHLRPLHLGEFIGQTRQKERLSIALQASRERGVPVPHLLISGPPGLGKTSIAHIVATERGAQLTTVAAPALRQVVDLASVLACLQPNQVLFIDEIHRVPRAIEEVLYSAMEDFRLELLTDDRRPVAIPLPPFTLIGATTRPGMLGAPLRNRFGLHFAFEFYTPDELAQVASQAAGRIGVVLPDEAAAELARSARGTPRICNRLLTRVRDYAHVKRKRTIDVAVVRACLDLEGVDRIGLDGLDRRYLQTIVDRYEGGPVGLSTLAATMQEDVDTLLDIVEPYLLHIGFVTRTAQGRRATAAASRYLATAPRS